MMPTILVVEDNPTTLKLVRFALAREGCELLEAADGKTALAILDARAPNLVLQDLCLPDIDGFELVAEIRRRCGPTVPILAFSGFMSQADEAHVAAAGFDGVIPKPVEPSRLVELVRGHLPQPPTDAADALVGRTILAADDDPQQLKLLRFRLDRMGCVVLVASDGAEALALAKKHVPDAIVSDVMMPGLDGFALAMAVRADPGLAHVPVVLLTSTYVDESDRELGRRAGASAFVFRTPDLRDLSQALVYALAASVRGKPDATALFPISAEDGNVERERVARVQRQLERQVSINSGLSQRCTTQASELAVLAGITEAVITGVDLGQSLDDVLEMCFDAAGVSVGALYLLDAAGQLKARVLGGSAKWTQQELDDFFGHEHLLRHVIESRRSALLHDAPAELSSREVLARSGAASALVLPLVHGSEPLGALFVMSRTRQLDDPDWLAFARKVANQLTLAVALTRSIDARTASEAAAVEARSQLRAVFDNIPDVVMVVDAQGLIQFVNRVFAPYTMAQVLGSSLFDHAPAEQRATVIAALASVLATGQSRSYEVTTTAPDGALVSTSNHIGPVRLGASITGAVIVGRDVTESKRTAAQLIASDRMASVGLLAAGVAHEINNPLAAIIANLDLSLERVGDLTDRLGLPRNTLDELQDARECAERIRIIVRDLKLFSRADDERRGPVDTRRVAESTLRMVGNEIRHRAHIVTNYGDVPLVEANEARLGQVFLNLIVNAAHAIPEGRVEGNEIRISTRPSPSGDVIVEIADTGTGMPPEVCRQLFTPFFTTKPIGEGTGLGLAICQRIVMDLGGTIEVESEVGHGTVFRLHLPRADAEAAPQTTPRAAVAPLRRRGRILVIDDDPMLIAVFRRSLSAAHEVTTTTRAQEALDLLAAGERYDVILCDLMMPDLTGMDFHEALSISFPDLAERVIFVTGGAFTPRAREFLERVPNLRLEKPFASQQLRALVNDRIR